MLISFFFAAAAWASSPCAALKPKQEADEGAMKVVNTVVQAAQASLQASTGMAAAPRESPEQLSLLRGDDLARAWFVYQICTLKEAGLLSPEKAESLVETVLVGDPAAPAPADEPRQEPGQAHAAPPGARGARMSAAGGRPTPGPHLDRNAFATQNAALPNLASWLLHAREISACIVPGGESVTVSLAVTGEGVATVTGADASCLQPIVASLGWVGPASYDVALPLTAPAAAP